MILLEISRKFNKPLSTIRGMYYRGVLEKYIERWLSE